jgi:ADP-ribose pyrophosphatase YjhB (NUDIX family)
VGRRESPEEAAVREVREELDVGVADLALIATYESSAEGKRDTIHLFKARALDIPATESIEVAEARFFPLDALPEGVSPATLRRIFEIGGERPIDGRW